MLPLECMHAALLCKRKTTATTHDSDTTLGQRPSSLIVGLYSLTDCYLLDSPKWLVPESPRISSPLIMTSQKTRPCDRVQPWLTSLLP